jgi:hypothetical protein
LLAGAGSSVVLYVLFFNQLALIPLALDAFILWSVLGARWFVPTMNS